jgi:hypothetical protein
MAGQIHRCPWGALIFLGGATLFAIFFIIVGIKVEALNGLVDAGTTILIGNGMLLFNKARGGDQK